ncbi:putative DNA repair protein RAD5A [Nannochloris sp. 'desiccata']|nr:hypothetical protein KSW81_004917 [Chlorella desiccata (nom. nud.)]KAH7618102.1 putative DNA repair protein RAD5A [Chlorella desiccata (nom. nud.)]
MIDSGDTLQLKELVDIEQQNKEQGKESGFGKVAVPRRHTVNVTAHGGLAADTRDISMFCIVEGEELPETEQESASIRIQRAVTAPLSGVIWSASKNEIGADHFAMGRTKTTEAQELARQLDIDLARAQELLSYTDGDRVQAAALHRAEHGTSRAGPSNDQSSGSSSRPNELQKAVQEMGLPSITLQQANSLLKVAGNSVERAVELYLETPSSAGPRGRVSAAAPDNDEPIVIGSSSNEDEGESEGTSDSEDDSNREGSQEDSDGGNTNGAPLPALLNRLFQPLANEPSTSDSSFSSSSSDDDDDDIDTGSSDMVSLPNSENVETAAAAKYLPSIEEAFYRAGRDYPSKVSKSRLPFPQYRQKNGSLYAPAPATIPTFAPPPHPYPGSADDKFLLGTIILPVHSVNPEVLETLDKKQPPGTELQWSSTVEGTVHDYVMPTWGSHSAGIWAEQLSKFYSRDSRGDYDMLFNNQAPVQLSLGGPELADTEAHPTHTTGQMPAVTVRSQNTWVKELISTLGILENVQLIEVVYTLVRQDHNEEEERGCRAIGSAGRKRSLSSPREDEIAPNSAKKKGRIDAAGKALGKRTPPIEKRPLHSNDPNPRPLGLPTHVKVAVLMNPRGQAADCFYKGTTGDIIDWTSNKKGSEAEKLNRFWRYHNYPFSYLLRALFTHGQGTLRLGPDSDGLLNICDISTKEAEKVDKMPSQELSSQFDVANILNSISVTPELAKKRGLAPMPKGMLSKPKKYQLSGLKWMLDREQMGDARDRGHLALHPAWMQLVSQSGHIFYLHRIKHRIPSWNFFTAPPQGTCGGFICDEMGLGKSLQTLMLVKQNPPPPNWAIEEFSPEMTVSHTEPIPIKTTLLVAPTTLLTQWEEEIGKHLAPGALRYGRFVDPLDRKALLSLLQQAPNAVEVASVAGKRARRAPRLSIGGEDITGARSSASGSKGTAKEASNKDEIGAPLRRVMCALPDGTAAEIQTLDICLCSYEDLRDQLGASHGNNLSALQQFGYWRVCLDEAQLIANSSSVAAVMASSLWRRHAWVVTGTPISSRLSEVRGLLEFLALEPYFDNAAWSDLVQSGCDDRERHGLLSLRSLLRGVMLRRSKQDVADELDLPPCVREDLPVVLSTAERAAYERLKREFLDAVKQYRRHQDASTNFVRTHNNYAEEANRSRALARATARAYASLISLRQSTCHPQMVASNAALMGSERLSMSDIIDRLVTQAYGEFDGAVRTLFDEKVYQLAVGVCIKGENPAKVFDSLLESVDDNALIAGLLMVPRNTCIDLRKEDGALRHAAILGDTSKIAAADQTADILAREKLVEMENKDVEECEKEDRELEERREVYKQQLREIAENWDKEILEKEIAKKKGGGKRLPSSFSNASPAAGINAAQGKNITSVEKNGEGAVEEGKSVACTEPSFKAKRYARNQLGPMPDLPPKRRQLRREAASRRRYWDRLKLATLELKLHLIKEEIGIVKGKWSSEAKARAAERKESGENDPQANFEVTMQELDSLRAELCLVPDFATGGAAGGGVALGVVGGGASGSGALASGDGSAGNGDAIELNGDANGDSANAVSNNDDASGGAAEIGDAAAAAATAALFDAAANIRRSRRQAGIDADSTTEIILDPEELAAQLENAIMMVRHYKGICSGRDPEGLTQRHVETARNDAKELFHRLNFVKQQHEDVTRMTKVTAAPDNANGGASGSGLNEEKDNEQDDLTRCPICFDDLTTAPLTMTRCSHRFCTDCIRESLERAAPQPAPCPICRTELRESDLFEALSEAEAVVVARAAAATDTATSEYGAKVAAALDILRDMQDSEGPGSKCLIFSSWGRALRLVGDALTANKVKFASLAGSVSTKRAALLNEFMHDPDCTVLLVLLNTSGGAAGLTLTMASTAILLEPCINPGLEAQAAARIYRMGQTRPTRVVRLIAEDSVDVQIAEQQRKKLEAGTAAAAAGNIKADEADYGTIVALAERLAASTTAGGDVMEEDVGPAAV